MVHPHLLPAPIHCKTPFSPNPCRSAVVVLQDIGPLFTACPNLHTLKLQGCRLLEPAALQPLSCQVAADEHVPHVLPQLQVLDVSYCPLPCQELAALMLHATQLQVSQSSANSSTALIEQIDKICRGMPGRTSLHLCICVLEQGSFCLASA